MTDMAPNWDQVPGAADGLVLGYIDQDVHEVARAFTGWTLGDGRYISDGVDAPKTGLFHYVEAWHDPYQKRFLGVEFEPNQAPMADGDRVLDILATHPGTAAFVCKKLIRRLLVDDPDPAMIDRIAAVFLTASDMPDQIAQVIRAIVAEPAFVESPPTKLRRPSEFLAGLYRATGAEVKSPETAWDWQLSRAGWHQHSYGPPTGHPDLASRWSSASTLNRYVDIALFARDEWFGCTDTRLGEATPKEARSFAAIAGHWVAKLRGADASDLLAELAEGFGISDMDAPMYLSSDDLQGGAAMAGLCGNDAAVYVSVGLRLRPRICACFFYKGDGAGHLIKQLLDLSQIISGRIWSDADGAARPYAPDVDYPADNPISAPLMTIAQTLKLGMGTRVATVDVPGWDTHVRQSGAFSVNVRWLTEGLMAFWRDLGPLQQDTSVVVMSEFGRRLRSNASGGTDHGRGNVMMVLGPKAKGGRMLGRWPGLPNEALEDGADLAVTTDYRAVLVELMSGHMEAADLGTVFPGFVPPASLGLWG